MYVEKLPRPGPFTVTGPLTWTGVVTATTPTSPFTVTVPLSVWPINLTVIGRFSNPGIDTPEVFKHNHTKRTKTATLYITVNTWLILFFVLIATLSIVSVREKMNPEKDYRKNLLLRCLSHLRFLMSFMVSLGSKW